MIDKSDELADVSEFLEPEDNQNDTEQFTEFTPIIVGRNNSHCNLYKARRYGQWWLLKCLNETTRDSTFAREILRKEFNVGVGLWHPNIARFISFFPIGELQSPTIVTEYIDGVELGTFLSANPALEVKLKILDEIIDAMKYYNSKQVVHCDLKPSNILITHNGHNVKIIDFGLASADAYKFLNGQGGNDVFGAPEQKKGTGRIDIRADIYAFGHIMNRFDLPNKYNRIITKCTQEDPAMRYQNPHELYNDFEAVKKREFPWFTIGMSIFGIILAVSAFVAGHRWSTAPARDLPTSRDAVIEGKMPAIFFSQPINLLTNDHYLRKIFVIPTGADVYYVNNDTTPKGPISEKEAVDMGLSVKWAPFNVGCTTANANLLGGFYSWGDPKGTFTAGKYTDYWPEGLNPPTTLPLNLDVAKQNWGGKWRIPTKEEWTELITHCKWKLNSERGTIMGYTVTGPSGKSIYLPLAGIREGTVAHLQGVKGAYWTSSTFSDHDKEQNRPIPFFITLTKNTIDPNDFDICTVGMSVRPVLGK